MCHYVASEIVMKLVILLIILWLNNYEITFILSKDKLSKLLTLKSIYFEWIPQAFSQISTSALRGKYVDVLEGNHSSMSHKVLHVL